MLVIVRKSRSLYPKRQERDGLGWADPVICTRVRTDLLLIEGHKVHFEFG